MAPYTWFTPGLLLAYSWLTPGRGGLAARLTPQKIPACSTPALPLALCLHCTPRHHWPLDGAMHTCLHHPALQTAQSAFLQRLHAFLHRLYTGSRRRRTCLQHLALARATEPSRLFTRGVEPLYTDFAPAGAPACSTWPSSKVPTCRKPVCEILETISS